MGRPQLRSVCDSLLAVFQNLARQALIVVTRPTVQVIDTPIAPQTIAASAPEYAIVTSPPSGAVVAVEKDNQVVARAAG